jgi:hypothetical protein
MCCQPTFTARRSRFFRRPFVGTPFHVRGLPPLASDCYLESPIHRCETTILFGHVRSNRKSRVREWMGNSPAISIS